MYVKVSPNNWTTMNPEWLEQCLICRGGWGFKSPYGSSHPQVCLTPLKNCQNKSKIHCWPPLVFPQIEYWTRVPRPVHQRTIATIGTNLDDRQRARQRSGRACWSVNTDELSTDRMDPRVGSRFCRISAGRVSTSCLILFECQFWSKC